MKLFKVKWDFREEHGSNGEARFLFHKFFVMRSQNTKSKGERRFSTRRNSLRAYSKITSGFYEHLLHTYFVKNTQRNPAMLMFFAS